MLRIIAIVQARMGSQRFPGKSMYLFQNKPSLKHLLESVVEVLPQENIFIATSQNIENLKIKDFAIENNFPFFMGDEENVASRFVSILEKNKADYFIRLNGDSPLFDSSIIKRILDLLNCTEGIDLITTAVSKTFPSGMNAELVKTSSFLTGYKNFSSNEHYEHVTKYFYENRSNHKIISLCSGVKNAKDCKFSFDTLEDKSLLEKIFHKLTKPHYCYTLEEKCEIYRNCKGQEQL